MLLNGRALYVEFLICSPGGIRDTISGVARRVSALGIARFFNGDNRSLQVSFYACSFGAMFYVSRYRVGLTILGRVFLRVFLLLACPDWKRAYNSGRVDFNGAFPSRFSYGDNGNRGMVVLVIGLVHHGFLVASSSKVVLTIPCGRITSGNKFNVTFRGANKGTTIHHFRVPMSIISACGMRFVGFLRFAFLLFSGCYIFWFTHAIPCLQRMRLF